MTTRLPSTGAPESAVTPATTCRSDEVVVIHRIFRRLFADAPRLVRDAVPGDMDRARFLARHLHGITTLLHVHHRTEDDFFWDPMRDRAPACGLHVALMVRQHEAVSDRLDAVDVLIDEWAASRADAAAAARLAAELDVVDRLLVEHLADEERDAFPVLDAVLSDEEWDDIHRHARRHKPPLPIFLLLGLMIDSVPADERDEWFATQMPAPLRLAYRTFGRRQYERALRRLFPERAVPAAVPGAPRPA